MYISILIHLPCSPLCSPYRSKPPIRLTGKGNRCCCSLSLTMWMCRKENMEADDWNHLKQTRTEESLATFRCRGEIPVRVFFLRAGAAPAQHEQFKRGRSYLQVGPVLCFPGNEIRRLQTTSGNTFWLHRNQ